jgi:hypothetical protein
MIIETWFIESLREDGTWTRYAGAFDDRERAEKYMYTLCGRVGYKVVRYVPEDAK